MTHINTPGDLPTATERSLTGLSAAGLAAAGLAAAGNTAAGLTAAGLSKRKPPMVILAGPTAVGKTELSLSLAEAIGAEIISADSMQVYRGLDIGSAKLPFEERRGIPHHLLDCVDPREEYHVVEFQRMAKEASADIWRRGRIPLVVGGTGFYIQALLYDIDFTDAGQDDGFRQALFAEADSEEGKHRLHDRLKEVDPESAEAIPAGNVRRVIRALEYFHETGEMISVHNREERKRESPYNFALFVLNMSRDRLYERINLRVDQMLEEGLVEEVRTLRNAGCEAGMTSMQGLGYKELFGYLEGKCSLEDAAEDIRRATRHYAKRQVTWFKRERDVVWLDKDVLTDTGAQLAFCLDELKRREIIYF